MRDGSPRQGAPRVPGNHQRLRTERQTHHGPPDSSQVINRADSVISDIKRN